MKTLLWIALLSAILASIMKINAQSDSGQKRTDSILKFIGLKSAQIKEPPRSFEYVPATLKEEPPLPATAQPTPSPFSTDTPPPPPPVLDTATLPPPPPPPLPIATQDTGGTIANFLQKILDWF